MPSPSTPTNTLLPSNNRTAQEVVELASVELLGSYQTKGPKSRVQFEAEIAKFMSEVSKANVSPEFVAGWWSSMATRNPLEAKCKEILGWLFIHSGLMSPDENAWVGRLRLKNDPWGIYPKVTAPHDPVQVPESQCEQVDAIGTHPEFLATIGGIKNQPILILEDLVDGGYCLLWLLYGAMKYWQFDRSDSVRFAIADMTGEDYWGFSSVEGLLWQAGGLPDLVEPAVDEDPTDYLEMMEFREGLPFAYQQLLPIMECTYSAMAEYAGRMARKRRKETDFFHPFYVVFRRWNVMLRLWKGMAAKGDISQAGLNQAWRKVYGHDSHDRVDLSRDIDFLLQTGDSVNMIPVLTTTEFGRVEAIGVDQSQLNSMAMIVPGDYADESNRGFKALFEVARDTRLRLGLEGNRIRDNLEKAIAWSAATGDQVALVIGGREPGLFRVSKSVKGSNGEETNIRAIPSRKMLRNYRFAAAS